MVRKIFLWLVIVAIVVIAAFLAWQWYADAVNAARRPAGVIHEAATA